MSVETPRLFPVKIFSARPAYLVADKPRPMKPSRFSRRVFSSPVHAVRRRVDRACEGAKTRGRISLRRVLESTRRDCAGNVLDKRLYASWQIHRRHPARCAIPDIVRRLRVFGKSRLSHMWQPASRYPAGRLNKGGVVGLQGDKHFRRIRRGRSPGIRIPGIVTVHNDTCGAPPGARRRMEARPRASGSPYRTWGGGTRRNARNRTSGPEPSAQDRVPRRHACAPDQDNGETGDLTANRARIGSARYRGDGIRMMPPRARRDHVLLRAGPGGGGCCCCCTVPGVAAVPPAPGRDRRAAAAAAVDPASGRPARGPGGCPHNRAPAARIRKPPDSRQCRRGSYLTEIGGWAPLNGPRAWAGLGRGGVGGGGGGGGWGAWVHTDRRERRPGIGPAFRLYQARIMARTSGHPRRT